MLEVALTLGLLLSAGVLVRSFIKLLSVDPGFQTENVLVFKVPFSYEFLPEEDALIKFQLRTEEILGQISSLPGVQWAATGSVPLRGFLGGGVYPEGSQAMIPVLVNPVSQDFFRVLGIRLLQGRVFGVEDSRKSMSKVAVINQSLARRLWENENPIGSRMRFGLNQEDWLTVVGVVEDVRRRGLHIQPSNEVYLPFLQSGSFADGQFMVKAQSDVAGLVPVLAQTIREFDKSLPLAEVKLLSEVLSDSTSSRKLVLWLIATFGAASLLVASIGLYGVVASYASHRRAEFGVRMALGATREDILKLCIGNGLSLLVVGGMLGLGGAYFLSHRMSHLLYETSPTDPLAYASVALLLLAVGGLACFFPAYKAARLSPNAVLRVE